MAIKTLDDWIELAKATVPKLADYVFEFRNIDIGMFNDTLNGLIEKQDWVQLHNKFEDIHFALPDIPEIRRLVFFDLCDLCSEWNVWKDDADVIDWQDIRLVCGEGKLTAQDVYKAVNIILRQKGFTREEFEVL